MIFEEFKPYMGMAAIFSIRFVGVHSLFVVSPIVY